MTQNAFMSVLRDYASIARRKRVSYAVPVHALVALREARIRSDVTDVNERERLIASMHDAVMREYGREDAGFTFDAVG